jgi:protoporphyrinogen oxidase
VTSSKGKKYLVDHLISSIPANKSASLFPSIPAFSEIPFIHMAVVNLAYSGDVIPVQGL